MIHKISSGDVLQGYLHTLDRISIQMLKNDHGCLWIPRNCTVSSGTVKELHRNCEGTRRIRQERQDVFRISECEQQSQTCLIGSCQSTTCVEGRGVWQTAYQHAMLSGGGASPSDLHGEAAHAKFDLRSFGSLVLRDSN